MRVEMKRRSTTVAAWANLSRGSRGMPPKGLVHGWVEPRWRQLFWNQVRPLRLKSTEGTNHGPDSAKSHLSRTGIVTTVDHINVTCALLGYGSYLGKYSPDYPHLITTT